MKIVNDSIKAIETENLQDVSVHPSEYRLDLCSPVRRYENFVYWCELR